jgi:hypothetical protein
MLEENLEGAIFPSWCTIVFGNVIMIMLMLMLKGKLVGAIFPL